MHILFVDLSSSILINNILVMLYVECTRLNDLCKESTGDAQTTVDSEMFART